MLPSYQVKICSFSLIISMYSLFACIGLFCLMVYIYSKVYTIICPDFGSYLKLSALIILGAGIGSKGLFLLTKIPDIIRHGNFAYLVKTIVTSGFVFYGGLFGALSGAAVYSKLFHIPCVKLLDRIIPSFPLFHMWGRVGCFFAGCCYGIPYKYGIPLASEPLVPRLPIQLIESIFLLALVIGLEGIRKNKAYLLGKNSFSLTNIYLFSYAFIRFLLEFFRGDDTARGIWLGLSTSQWISLLVIFYVLKREKKHIYNLIYNR